MSCRSGRAGPRESVSSKDDIETFDYCERRPLRPLAELGVQVGPSLVTNDLDSDSRAVFVITTESRWSDHSCPEGLNIPNNSYAIQNPIQVEFKPRDLNYRALYCDFKLEGWQWGARRDGPAVPAALCSINPLLSSIVVSWPFSPSHQASLRASS